MTYILVSIIIILCLAIIYISISFGQSRNAHKTQVGNLKKTIVLLNETHQKQLMQLVLSDELQKNMRESRTKMDMELLAAQSDFISTLHKNNLIG